MHQQGSLSRGGGGQGQHSPALFSFRFLVFPVVCSLLLLSKPVAEDDDEQRGFARSRCCSGSHHLLLLLHHCLGEFSLGAKVGRGETKPELGSALRIWGRVCRSECWWSGRGCAEETLQAEVKPVVSDWEASVHSSLPGEFQTSPSLAAGKLCSHRKSGTTAQLPSCQGLIRRPAAAWLEANRSPGAGRCAELV